MKYTYSKLRNGYIKTTDVNICQGGAFVTEGDNEHLADVVHITAVTSIGTEASGWIRVEAEKFWQEMAGLIGDVEIITKEGKIEIVNAPTWLRYKITEMSDAELDAYIEATT